MKSTFALTGFMAIVVGYINLGWFKYIFIDFAVLIIGGAWIWLFWKGMKGLRTDKTRINEILTDPKYKPKGRWD